MVIKYFKCDSLNSMLRLVAWLRWSSKKTSCDSSKKKRENGSATCYKVLYFKRFNSYGPTKRITCQVKGFFYFVFDGKKVWCWIKTWSSIHSRWLTFGASKNDNDRRNGHKNSQCRVKYPPAEGTQAYGHCTHLVHNISHDILGKKQLSERWV